VLDPDPESASLMRIRIRIQGGHFYADPCGSGSETLVTTINILYIYYKYSRYVFQVSHDPLAETPLADQVEGKLLGSTLLTFYKIKQKSLYLAQNVRSWVLM